MQGEKKLGRSYSGATVFSSKVICGECGSFYGQKIWHSNDPYRKVLWRCNRKLNGKYICKTPSLNIETIKEKFLVACNQLLGDRKKLIEECKIEQKELSDCSSLNAEIERLDKEIDDISQMVKQCVNENASTKQSQNEYIKKYNSLVSRYDKAVKKHTDATEELNKRKCRERDLGIFKSMLLKKPSVLKEWDEELWIIILENATVHNDGRITFLFKNGTSIETGAE